MPVEHNTFVFSSSQVKDKFFTNLNQLFVDNGLKTARCLSIQFVAKHFKVNRSIIYESFEGFGSRRLRVAIAHVIGLKPSDIWYNRPERDMLIDDYDYLYGDKDDFLRFYQD